MFKYYGTFLFYAICCTLFACNKTPANSCIDLKKIDNEALCKGLNTLDGFVTYQAVADAHALPYQDAKILLKELRG